MILCLTEEDLNEALSKARQLGQLVGFVPTMGALHDGHFSLIQQSKRENNLTVCSIFVNPTQFNNSEDLIKYPRTLHEDAVGLDKEGCDILFAPDVKDIYPKGLTDMPEIDLKGLDLLMEGEHRPGHFNGVVQVVKRLIELVQPSHMYMGQKDYQQFTIIRYMIDYFQMDVELVVCPTLRERNGLAMSSRNMRLREMHRRDADIIYTVLNAAKFWLDIYPIAEIELKALRFMQIDGFKPEYFSIINGRTLQPINNTTEADDIVACTAVWAGNVRLIDNMTLRVR